MTDSITVIHARGRCLAKKVRADGSIESYDNAKTVDLEEIDVADLSTVERLLRWLAPHRDRCVVRGSIANPSRVRAVRRLLYRDAETGDEPTLREVSRQWLALDFDTLPLPAGVEPENLIACGSAAVETLPSVFRRVRTIVQATAGHGLKPGLRLRLWYWLERPVAGDELKRWLSRSPVDRSVFGPAQLIFTAAPLFLAGSFDPLPERLTTIAGHDVVMVPSPAALAPPSRPKLVTFDRDGRRDARNDHAIEGLVRSVAQAGDGNRNSVLYWAARRMADKVALHAIPQETARALLEAAAEVAGLPPNEAAATVRSGLRHG